MSESPDKFIFALIVRFILVLMIQVAGESLKKPGRMLFMSISTGYYLKRETFCWLPGLYRFVQGGCDF